MPRRRFVTEPLTPEQPAYGWHAPPPWWAGLDEQILALITGEIARVTDTLRTDWRMLRFAWAMLRLWLS